ncbi:MAG: hypothetical protein D6735_00215 [Acidobacteria bacterium]|jgi:hypothetical protein|nr:MAG: hypothetical protein DDG59_10565 [Anaerolineae bacterium]RMG09748.1 MAG: hypothetical protein D6735_00215 [Acidobacteriota bacterium]
MPLIDPSRLEKQIQQCFSVQSNASLFVEAIKELLDSYADHAYRPGELATLPSFLKSYHVPQPLLRTLKKELAVFCQSESVQALSIAKELWEEPYQECKELAISILEKLPLEMEAELLKTVEQWVSSCTHLELIESIAQNGLNTIRKHQTASLIERAQNWLIDERPNMRKFGFLVLQKVSDTISFSDLPLLFKVISPFLNRCPIEYYQDVVLICNALIGKSPKEMAYLMRKAITENPSADARKLMKSCLNTFPPELQTDLKAAIQR